MANNNKQVNEELGSYVQETPQLEPETITKLPEQTDFYKVPRRFGSIPVDELPLGCDKKEQYYKIYPRISLPFQKVESISFGHPELESNRLFFGDNLHVMRMLPSESIDLIYIDPPFFSGRNYNVIFGDANEVRSFTDIWEGGMPGYLTWLNARLLEMKRLLKPTGSIYVHLDWHASHYVKVEMDKIFGVDNFRNEIVWCYSAPSHVSKNFPRKHDVLLFYAKTSASVFEPNRVRIPYSPESISRANRNVIKKGGTIFSEVILNENGKIPEDWWEDIKPASRHPGERIGYPTQKPETLLERIIKASSNEGGIVADFFCGGGTTPVAAQKLGRRWIGCDISRIAVAITADRVTNIVTQSNNGESKQFNKQLLQFPIFQ